MNANGKERSENSTPCRTKGVISGAQPPASCATCTRSCSSDGTDHTRAACVVLEPLCGLCGLSDLARALPSRDRTLDELPRVHPDARRLGRRGPWPDLAQRFRAARSRDIRAGAHGERRARAGTNRMSRLPGLNDGRLRDLRPLTGGALARALEALNGDGEETRVVGGAVRDLALG